MRALFLEMNFELQLCAQVKRSIFCELRESAILPPSEKGLARLEQEGTLIVMAGTESTAKSIGIAHFHLLSNPEIMRHVRAELRIVAHSASGLSSSSFRI